LQDFLNHRFPRSPSRGSINTRSWNSKIHNLQSNRKTMSMHILQFNSLL